MTDETKQVNVKLPKSLVAQIDERRREQGLTRDEWAKRAFTYCLSLPKPNPTP